MVWDAKDDLLKYKSKFKSVDEWKEFLKIEKWTKRTILKTTASTYDPLGYLSALTVQARAVIQKLWLLDLQWDDVVNKENETEWIEALENLVNVEKIKLDRWSGMAPELPNELHIFCDASEKVYSVVAYCRVNSVGGPIVNIICAKARVTPIKSETISRLELIACVLGVRLSRAINTVYNIPKENVHFWTDSRNALCWIHTPSSKMKVYVQNRVGEIQRCTDYLQWHHVSSENNPADIPTRPVTTDELIENDLWWHGPEFLKSDVAYPIFDPGTISPEVKDEMKEEVTLLSVTKQNLQSEIEIH